MHWICQWLLSLDPPTRAAIIGATATVVSVAIAFFGVLLTIRSNRVRAREDQLITLRREAYLEACDVTAEAIQFLTTLGDPDITLASGVSVMRKVGGAMGKLHILADQTTLDVVMTYLNAFLDEYIGLAKLKSVFQINAAGIATAQQRVALLSGDAHSLANTLEERNRLKAQISQLSLANVSLAEQILQQSVKVVNRLNGPATAVTLALRKELNLSLDEDWYKRMQGRNMQLNETRLQPMLDVIHDTVATIQTVGRSTQPR